MVLLLAGRAVTRILLLFWVLLVCGPLDPFIWSWIAASRIHAHANVIMASVLPRDPQAGVRPVPVPGQVISVVLSFAAITVLSIFLSMPLSACSPLPSFFLTTEILAQRFLVIRAWTRLPFVVWREWSRRHKRA